MEWVWVAAAPAAVTKTFEEATPMPIRLAFVPEPMARQTRIASRLNGRFVLPALLSWIAPVV